MSSPDKTTFILDLKGNVDSRAVDAALHEAKPDVGYALTPSAMFQLERLNVPYKTLGDEIDFRLYSQEGAALFATLLQTFRDAYGADHEPYLCRMGYPLKIFIDF